MRSSTWISTFSSRTCSWKTGISEPAPPPNDTGARGEDLAAKYLADSGYQIIHRNWRCPAGEIDIICLRPGELVFVEIKTRVASAFSSRHIFDSVHRRKKRRLLSLAEAYVRRPGRRYRRCRKRIDVIGVVISPLGGLVELTHLRAAVGYEE